MRSDVKLEQRGQFLSVGSKGRELHVDNNGVRDFLNGHAPGYMVAASMRSLVWLGYDKIGALKNGSYDESDDQRLINEYANTLSKNAQWEHLALGEEALRRHLIVASEFLSSIDVRTKDCDVIS